MKEFYFFILPSRGIGIIFFSFEKIESPVCFTQNTYARAHSKKNVSISRVDFFLSVNTAVSYVDLL